MSRVKRFDFARLPTKGTRTPQGFLRVDSNPTGVGIFAYRRRDGKIVRELRPPDEVFKADSLATLRGAPVTDLHPSEMVKPSNARTHTVGFTNEDVRRDGDKVAASHTLIDERMISAVERRDRIEVSCGYECAFDPSPGRFDGTNYGPHVTSGEPYDGVQRNIVYNHVALGPRNWGRQGKNVALKLDAKGELELGDDDAIAERTDADDVPGSPQPNVEPDPSRETPPARKRMDLINIRVDGVEYEVPKAAAPHILKAIETRDSKITELTGAKEKAEGRADAAEKSLTDTKEKLTKAEDPKRIDAAVEARTGLIGKATKVLGKDFKFDGLTTRQVHEATLKKLDEKLDLKERSDDYVSARFDAAVDQAADDNKRNTRRALLDTSHTDDGDVDDDGDREDADDDDTDTDADAGGKGKRADNRPAWRRPLAYSNDR